jgi:hypothetical protein
MRCNCDLLRMGLSVDELSAETVARDQNYLFQRYRPFITYESVKNNGWLHVTVAS